MLLSDRTGERPNERSTYTYDYLALPDTEEKIQEKAGHRTWVIRQHVDLSSINLHTTVIVATIMFG